MIPFSPVSLDRHSAKDAHHQGHVRQMRTARKRIVDGNHISWLDRSSSSAAATAIGIEPRCTGM